MNECECEWDKSCLDIWSAGMKRKMMVCERRIIRNGFLMHIQPSSFWKKIFFLLYSLSGFMMMKMEWWWQELQSTRLYFPTLSFQLPIHLPLLLPFLPSLTSFTVTSESGFTLDSFLAAISWPSITISIKRNAFYVSEWMSVFLSLSLYSHPFYFLSIIHSFSFLYSMLKLLRFFHSPHIYNHESVARIWVWTGQE